MLPGGSCKLQNHCCNVCAAGTAASTLVACLGGVAAFLVGSVVAWGFVLAAHELWTASNIPRRFSCKDVCAGVKMVLGLAPISSHTPSWDMDMALQTAVHEHACDMTCPITMNVCVEPCSLQGHLFERRCVTNMPSVQCCIKHSCVNLHTSIIAVTARPSEGSLTCGVCRYACQHVAFLVSDYARKRMYRFMNEQNVVSMW